MGRESIKEVLLRIKEAIKEAEGGKRDKALIDGICTDFYSLMELLKMFLISERESYYGYFLMNLQFKANPFINSVAGIKLNTFPPVFESNPLLLCKYSLKEIIYVMCHEIDHIVYNHPAEMVKSNPEGRNDLFYKFNLAADASVNDKLDDEIESENHKFMSPLEGRITSDVLGEMFKKILLPLESYAYYYRQIVGEDIPDEGSQNGESSLQNGEGSHSEQSPSQDGDGSSQSGNDADDSDGEGDGAYGIVTANSTLPRVDHNWEAGEDAEEATAIVREIVNSVVDMMNAEVRGLMPAEFTSQVELINKPPRLSWQAILKKYVGTISASKRKTRTRLNRRQPQRFDLPGKVDDKVIKVVVAIDTSASVNDEMAAKIFNEIFEILAKRKHDVTVIECDSKVQRVYKARTRDEIKTELMGRGGTLFTPVIEYVNKDKRFRDALLIYFTDGEGEYEIPKPMTYRNIWVIVDGDESSLSLREPYGTVMPMGD